MHTQSKFMDFILDPVESLSIPKNAVDIRPKLLWFCQVPELCDFFLTREVVVIDKVFQFIFNVLKTDWFLNYCKILSIIRRQPEWI